MVKLLNEDLFEDSNACFFKFFYAKCNEFKVYPNEKEKYIINSLPNLYYATNGLMAYKFKETQGYLNAILAFTMETAEVPLDFFNNYSLTLRGRTTQGVTAFKN